jgi:hypothetical protein
MPCAKATALATRRTRAGHHLSTDDDLKSKSANSRKGSK